MILEHKTPRDQLVDPRSRFLAAVEIEQDPRMEGKIAQRDQLIEA